MWRRLGFTWAHWVIVAVVVAVWAGVALHDRWERERVQCEMEESLAGADKYSAREYCR